MLTQQQILTSLRGAKPLLEQKYGISRLGLFGSYSRNEAVEKSDIDLMVEFSKPIGIRFIDLADELEALFHHKVDLVSRNGIKPLYFEAIKGDMIYV